MDAEHRLAKECLLKKYSAQTIEYVEALFPSTDLKDLIQDYAELFTIESHEPESFKKNLGFDMDHALMPISHQQPSPKFKPKFYDEKKTLYSPFEATGLTKNHLDSKVWYYLEEDSSIKGPFSTVDMDRWFNHGDLHGSTKVAYDQKEKFCKIYKFVEIFKEFELESDNTNNKYPDSKQTSKEAPHSFKKFGFVNQHKNKSAGNSPLQGKNSLARDDPIDENDDDNHKDKGSKKEKSTDGDKKGKNQSKAPEKTTKKPYNYEDVEHHDQHDQHDHHEHHYNYKKKPYGKNKKEFVTEYVPKSNN